MVGASLGTLGELIIGNGEGYLVRLSMGLTLGLPLEFLNPGAVMTNTLMDTYLGLWFGYALIRY